MNERTSNARLDRAAAGAKAVDRVIARIDERDQISCGTVEGHGREGKARLGRGVGTQAPPAGIDLRTTPERAVDKVLAEHLARLSGAVDEINRASVRVSAAHRVTDRLYVPCPQGADCQGDGKHHVIFDCDQCEFKGCAVCMNLHDSEPHWSDSRTTAERIGG